MFLLLVPRIRRPVLNIKKKTSTLNFTDFRKLISLYSVSFETEVEIASSNLHIEKV